MRPLLALGLLLTAAAALFLLTAAGRTVRPATTGNGDIKLAVLVVFDQLRGDYPERWQPLFGPDGFERLKGEGAWFTRCYYPYGTTTTGPGHASMLTGTCPDRHGIVNNHWIERGTQVYCAGSDRYQFVTAPLPPDSNPKAKPKEVGNPDRLLAETVADVLKAANPRSKVFGLSLKDRSAILPTGRRPDGAYWFQGRFVTSTYYADGVHPWVERFNASKVADRWFGKDWTRFRSDLDYAEHSGPDVAPGEGKGVQVTAKDDPARGWSQGVAFPHPNTGGRDRPGKEYYESLANSPFGNDLLLELAKTCVIAEELGADDVPDLLVVSFSSNDLIGHTWGPDSQEVLDVTLRTDALLADWLRFLDAHVGKGHYLLALTADHGVCPLPEAPHPPGVVGKRVPPGELQKAVEEHLTAKFGTPAGPKEKDKKPVWVEAFSFPWLYFNPAVVAAAGKSRDEVAAAAAAVLRTHPDVARAFTRAELAAGFPESDAVGNLMKRSYHPARCGDVGVVLKEWYLPSAVLATGTTHGAPYDYDRHVPLMFLGPGIAGGVRDEPTTPQATAAGFAKYLGLRLPNKAEFPVPATLEAK